MPLQEEIFGKHLLNRPWEVRMPKEYNVASFPGVSPTQTPLKQFSNQHPFCWKRCLLYSWQVRQKSEDCDHFFWVVSRALLGSSCLQDDVNVPWLLRFSAEELLIVILCSLFTSKAYANVETRNLITMALVVVKMPHPESSLAMLLIYSQILWSKKFADAIFSDRNSKDKAPLQLAVEKGHVKWEFWCV